MSDSDKGYRQRVRRARLGLRLVRSAGRKRQSWLDRLLTRLLRRALSPAPGADFMRDDLVDAGVEFDAQELARYQQSGTTPLEGAAPVAPVRGDHPAPIQSAAQEHGSPGRNRIDR